MPPCYTDLEPGQRPLIPISYQGKMYIFANWLVNIHCWGLMTVPLCTLPVHKGQSMAPSKPEKN